MKARASEFEMQKNKNTLTWLHLSDLHYCKPRTGWDAKDILVHLPTDLREMEKQYGLRPDLVLFTGDLAFGNLKPDPGWNLEDQYAGVAQFLESVRGAFSRKIPRSHVFIVPGNHDVDRADVSRFVTPWLDALKSDDEIIDMIHKGGRDWQDCIQRLHAYRKFLEIHDYNHLLTDSERLVYAIQQEINGITVGIGGLNSAWSCSRPSNEEKGKLWMGARWQAKIIHDALKGSDLTLALAHHPPGWMARSEEVFLKTGALEKFHFFFHGHEHNDWPLTIDGRHVTLSAGACYKRSDK